ncbi:MAG: UvrD-helicase domain-containing protein, partial [Paramuribaculum sp.]|nr:UvrD-helicase domain-containing protein [Paramuribaculum sp.]
MLTIYRASAGSGKTFTLAREYIKLLLGKYDESARRFRLCKESNRHRSILGVTFTNKATEEMQRRIIHELAVLAKMETGWENVKSPYE